MEKEDIDFPVSAQVYMLEKTGTWRAGEMSDIGHGQNDDAFCWVDLSLEQNGAFEWLAEDIGIDPLTCEALFHKGTRPRVSRMNDGLMVILRGVNCNPGHDPEDMVAVRMLFCDDMIITLRKKLVMAVRDIQQMIQKGDGPESKGDFLVFVTELIADRMGDVVQDLDETVDQIEEDLIEPGELDLASTIADAKRMAIHLRRYIAPQRDTLYRLAQERVPWMSEIDRAQLKEVAERTARFVDDIDSARERAGIAFDEVSNQMAGQMNRAIYTLSIVTTVFLPLGLLTGLLGINVGGMPGAEFEWAFWLVTVLIVVLGLGLVWWFKRIKWL